MQEDDGSEVKAKVERESLPFDRGHMALTPLLPSNHTLHRFRKPAYRGTRRPGLRGPPRAGTPGPGWSHRREGGRRAPPAAVHTPGSSCSRPAPGAPPVGIGVAARGRHTVLGTAGHTPAEIETPLSRGCPRWAVRPSQLATSLPGGAPESHRPALEPWPSHGTHCGHEHGLWTRVLVPALPLIS